MTTPATRVWTETGWQGSDWRHGADAQALSEAGRVILPLDSFLALDAETRRQNAARIGVLLDSGEALESILPFLPELSLVALAFPAFNDGRSYSKAELLRSRYGFRGEVRATGDVLIDQISHMLRVGFSTLEITNLRTLSLLDNGKKPGLPLYYQPSAHPAVAPGSYGWRRLSA